MLLQKECIRDATKPIKIVIEVERANDAENKNILSTVSSLAKEFAHYANVLVVVSEANATLGFTNDSGRQTIFWMDDMSDNQVSTFFQKRIIPLSQQELQLIRDSIGFQPLTLGNLVKQIRLYSQNSNMNNAFGVNQFPPFNLQSFINEQVANAKSDLIKFSLYPILHALKTHPNGVEVEAFAGQEFKSVDLGNPEEVFTKMKRVNAVMYHSPSRQYRMISKAHATALANYDVPVPK